MPNPSLNLESLKLSPKQLPKVLRLIDKGSDEEALKLIYDWSFWARPKQLEPPGNWLIWLLKSGRGAGKTRSGAEITRKRVESRKYGRIALIADTAADARDVMVEGDSGLLSVCPPYFKPRYEPSKRRLTWPNGAIATCYAAESPESLRGPQHDFGWCDELAKWKNLRKKDVEGGTAWDNFMFGLRKGDHPQAVVTTTPRPVKLLKELQAKSTTVVTTESSYANKDNLSPEWFKNVILPYESTRLGRQEIHAEDIEDVEGALWNSENIEANRVDALPVGLTRIVVAIDPSVSSNKHSDECGIIVAGLGTDGHGYVLADESLRASPHVWASNAIKAYHAQKADRIVAEVNNGGDLVELVIRTIDQNVPYTKVHASRGKITRAEPIAAIYEQNKVHHVGMLALLEDEMRTWTPGDESPNRMDALVWALTELFIGEVGLEVLFSA